MARNSVNDIAAVVARKLKISKKDATDMVGAFFNTIADGLREDRQVKVRGLGTFKVTAVKARESVNVNTGGRVIIEGHDKVSFLPDQQMKDLVNKPFAQFTTVEVNEGVNFDAVDIASKAGDEAQEQDDEKPENKERKELEPEEEKAPETDEEVSETEREVPKADEREPDADDTVEFENPEQPDEQSDDALEETVSREYFDEQMSACRHRCNRNLILSIVLLIAGLIGGFFIGRYYTLSRICVERPLDAERAAIADTTGSVKEEADFAATIDSTKTQVDNSQKDVQKKDTTTKKMNPTEPKTEAEPDIAKLNSDRRLRFGAYEIIGIDRVVKLKKGQTMQSFSNKTLGKDMVVYFQVLNGVDDMQAGDSLKVPKIRLKKQFRK